MNYTNKKLQHKLNNHFNNAINLDLETNGLAGGNTGSDASRNKEIINFSAVDATTGTNVYTTLIKPHTPISSFLKILNALNDETNKDAPSFIENYPLMVDACKGKKIIGWNIQFDVNTMQDEALKYNKDFIEEAGITGYEDGMELFIKACGLFPFTANSSMYLKQDEACKMLGTYVIDSKEVLKYCESEDQTDYYEYVKEYLNKEFTQPLSTQLVNQLGNKEMHLAFCDNIEYRLTMMKIIYMYNHGIAIDKDVFLDALMTEDKRNKYKACLEKEAIVQEAFNKLINEGDYEGVKFTYAPKLGGERAFDSIVNQNREYLEDHGVVIKNVSPATVKFLQSKYNELGDIGEVAKATGMDISKVKMLVNKNKSNNPHMKMLETLKKHNKPVKETYPEDLTTQEKDLIDTYSEIKSKQQAAEKKAAMLEEKLKEKVLEEKVEEKATYKAGNKMDITFDPIQKEKKSFNKDAFMFDNPKLYMDYLTNQKTPEREYMRFKPLKEVELPAQAVIDAIDIDDQFFNLLYDYKKQAEINKHLAQGLETSIKDIFKRKDSNRINSTLGTVTYSKSEGSLKLDRNKLKKDYPNLYQYYEDIRYEKDVLNVSIEHKGMGKSRDIKELYTKKAKEVERVR